MFLPFSAQQCFSLSRNTVDEDKYVYVDVNLRMCTICSETFLLRFFSEQKQQC